MQNNGIVHGQWIHWYRCLNDSGSQTKDYSRCSVCKNDLSGFISYQYCPNCGAIMDKKEATYNAE